METVAIWIVGLFIIFGCVTVELNYSNELETKKFNHESYMDSCRMRSQMASDSFYLELRRTNNLIEKSY